MFRWFPIHSLHWPFCVENEEKGIDFPEFQLRFSFWMASGHQNLTKMNASNNLKWFFYQKSSMSISRTKFWINCVKIGKFILVCTEYTDHTSLDFFLSISLTTMLYARVPATQWAVDRCVPGCPATQWPVHHCVPGCPATQWPAGRCVPGCPATQWPVGCCAAGRPDTDTQGPVDRGVPRRLVPFTVEPSTMVWN